MALPIIVKQLMKTDEDLGAPREPTEPGAAWRLRIALRALTWLNLKIYHVS